MVKGKENRGTLEFGCLDQFKAIFDQLLGVNLKIHTVDGGEVEGVVHSCTEDGILELWGGSFINIMQIAYFELANEKTFTKENVAIDYMPLYEVQLEISELTELAVDDETKVRAAGIIVGGDKTSVTDKIGPLLILNDKYAVLITKIQWFEFV